MTTPNDDDDFIRALRADLPTPKDEARVRARLIAAGVIGSAGLAAPGVAGAAGAGLIPKLLALPALAKLGVAVAVVGVAGAPIVMSVRSQEATTQTNAAASGASTTASTTNAKPKTATNVTEQSETARVATEPNVDVTAPHVAVVASRAVAPNANPESPRERARSLPAISRAEAATAAEAATEAERSPLAPPVEAAPAVIDEGTLRAETVLLERALQALQSGDTATANEALSEHAARFPNGLLARDRRRALARAASMKTNDTANEAP